MKRVIALLVLLGFLPAAFAASDVDADDESRVRLITLDPGHFHAALVQKYMYAGVDPEVRVYAPQGDDVTEHLKRIEAFNTRADSPTRWKQRVYTGPDYFEKMLQERAGNVVVISGNNARKTEYIERAVTAGMHVLADKPMAITPEDYARLRTAFETAENKGVLLADIMTERFEITTILQRELSRQPALFGQLERGTPDNPAINKVSVHHFSKTVAGAPLKRPQWFFDVHQEGEGLMDVGTHLVDLVQWQAFPDVSLQPEDAQVLIARRWPTAVTRAQFERVTGAPDFPDFLRKSIANGTLQIYSNGEATYRLRGIVAKVSVSWKFEAPPGGGDTHYSVMRGTRANLIVRQGAQQGFKPVLYVEKAPGASAEELEIALRDSLIKLQPAYPGIGLRREGNAWAITVPSKYDVGHEAHFAQVTEGFLAALRDKGLPEWEVPNLLTKYSTLAQAYEMSHSPMATQATGMWQREPGALSFRQGESVLWRFSFDPQTGNKPFFHPLAVAGGPALTQARPEDHPWHYGLWLSWKYINGVNYWEESRETDKPDGVTQWKLASLDAQPDGSANVQLDLSYLHPTGRVDLTEKRSLQVSAPATDGSYRIDWRSTFVAGPTGALLARTPMPGEPKGQVNGGYAGLGLRMAAEPFQIAFASSAGGEVSFKDNRWRPQATAIAANLSDAGQDIGGIAIVSDPANPATSGKDGASPWYVVDAPDQQMRFLCAAVLAPKTMQLAAGETLTLHYTIAVRRPAWTSEALQDLVTSMRPQT
jgi:predicted dehydrogenase